MTDPKTPLVVARLTSGGFSRSIPLPDLFASLAKTLPIDLLYLVLPYPDGSGYELREIGSVVVDFLPVGEARKSQMELPAISSRQPPAPSIMEDMSQVSDLMRGQSSPQGPSEPQGPSRVSDFKFGQEETNPFTFKRPKSQSEALKELGIVDPVRKLHKPVIEKKGPVESIIALEVEKGGGAKKKGRKRKAAKPALSEDLSGDDWDKGLPQPPRVSGPGQISITSTRQATPEEAAAASHFNKS